MGRGEEGSTWWQSAVSSARIDHSEKGEEEIGTWLLSRLGTQLSTHTESGNYLL